LVVAVPGPNGDLAGSGFSMMMMMMVIGWLVIATALFLLRPASLRRQSNEKPSDMVSVNKVLSNSFRLENTGWAKLSDTTLHFCL